MTHFPIDVPPAARAIPRAGTAPDDQPRVAVVTAFAPEIAILETALEGAETRRIGPATYITGRLEGREVVLFLSGISMVNAAMSTQAALDHFNVTSILFSGIAGGVDPGLGIGDVVVPARWGHFLEGAFARETDAGYALPGWMSAPVANFGMMHTCPVGVVAPGADAPQGRFWFDTDPVLLELAGAAAAEVELLGCDAEATPPRVVIGGNGISGPVFMDNAQFREHPCQLRGAGARHGERRRGAGGLCQRRALHRFPLAVRPRRRRRRRERDGTLHVGGGRELGPADARGAGATAGIPLKRKRRAPSGAPSVTWWVIRDLNP